MAIEEGPAWFDRLGLSEPERRFLPIQLTSFIGRQRELSDAKRLLATAPLLTLTGPGGSGKTRLCIQMAAETAAAFPEGASKRSAARSHGAMACSAGEPSGCLRRAQSFA